MVKNVNSMIREKIKNKEVDESISEFINKIFLEELDHRNESRWKYGKQYDRWIKKYSKKYAGEE